MDFNQTYSEEEFDLAFPRHVSSVHENGNTIPKYNRYWNTTHEIFLIIHLESDKFFYATFHRKNGVIIYINSGYDQASLLEASKHIWHPPYIPKKVNRKMLALETIQIMVMSLLKKGQTDKLIKSDLSYIYYSSDGWKAFYPTNETLLEFHNSLPIQDQTFIDFINSIEFAKMRANWESVDTITPGA